MTITEFLEARIAEDEAAATKHYPEATKDGWGDYPRRVVAECQAKRAIVERYTKLREDRRTGDWSEGVLFSLGLTVMDLAAVYADHADYDPAWRV